MTHDLFDPNAFPMVTSFELVGGIAPATTGGRLLQAVAEAKKSNTIVEPKHLRAILDEWLVEQEAKMKAQ